MNLGVYPLRPWQKFYLTNAGYLSKEYYDLFSKWHRGEDINMNTGGDTDLGYPVQSMFPGTVIYADTPQNSNWGGLVLVRTEEWLKKRIEAHLNTELDVLDILYAHLYQITVSPNDEIDAGDHIGSIGKGGGNIFMAHLHLEARRKILAAYEPQGGDDVALEAAREYTVDPKLILTLPLGDRSTLVSNARLELDNANLYHNDRKLMKNSIVVHRVEDKVFVKSMLK